MKSRSIKLLAPLLAFSVVAAACGGDDDDAGDDAPAATDAPADDGDDTADDGDDATDDGDDAAAGGSITVTGPERDESEAGALQEVLGEWGEAKGIEVTYIGDADWEANINTQVQGGNPPDLSVFPQPGKLADFARAGNVVPLNDEAVAEAQANWPASWNEFGIVDGVQYGVPAKADLKSLVWYQPSAFEAAGYTVPTTFDEFTALVDEMREAGGPKPLCVGIESGQATGWTFTDWVEDMVLRQHGPEVYDQWVLHEIPFNDERIVSTMQTVLDLWTEDNVFASSGTIAATAFQDNGQPLVDGDCYMHRQASFYSAFIPEGTAFADGSEGSVDVFYFPDINGDKPVLGAGVLVAAFNERPEVHELAAYMSSAEFAEKRQAAQAGLKGGGTALSGYLSANPNVDQSVFQPLEQSFLDILSSAAIVRFDASDLMPADVGAGTFWTEGTSAVNGDKTAQEAADAIEASWPAG